MTHSALYSGWVRHRRFTPRQHRFQYPLFMAFIDLDEVEDLEKGVTGFGRRWFHPARFRIDDHRLGQGSAKTALQDKAFAITGQRFDGPVRALCQLRYFGLYFSPLNLYYLHHGNGSLGLVLAQVSNTPWNQRHWYAVPPGSAGEHAKAFHVSPFNPMGLRYAWQLPEPGKRLKVNIDARPAEEPGQRHFDATMVLNRHPFNGVQLARLMAKTPVMTLSIVARIYWQAFKLWCKGVPFFSHPRHSHSSTGQAPMGHNQK